MKKVLVLVMTLVMAMALIACGAPAAESTDAESIEGTTWMITSMTNAGEEMDVTAMGDTYYTFEADGVLIVENTLTESGEGTWSQSGSTITITAGGASADYTLSDSTLSYDVDGSGVVLEMTE